MEKTSMLDEHSSIIVLMHTFDMAILKKVDKNEGWWDCSNSVIKKKLRTEKDILLTQFHDVHGIADELHVFFVNESNC